MTTRELKEKYLKFFEERRHKIISGASLIPENDPTALFISAGMHPLVPYLLGEKHPMGDKLVNVQKCIRTGDIDDVGDDVHLTFFEMLGNWGLGSYWKKEAIEMSCEFLTDKKWLGLDKNKIAVSVFAGDSDAPFDEKSYNLWLKKGILEKRIKRLPKKDNWWGPAGVTGPCGPCTEIFYWAEKKVDAPTEFNPQDKRWVEIWNNVFMEFNKQLTDEGKRKLSQKLELLPENFYYEPLKQRNVDTGMGVERTVAILSGAASVYETSESLMKIIEEIEKLSGKEYSRPELIRRTRSGGIDTNLKLNIENEGWHGYDREMRIIADHLRAATFIMGDEKGIVPSNVEQGYVLRKLIRRAIEFGREIGISKDYAFTIIIAERVIELVKDDYPELLKNKDFILEQLTQEEEKFNKIDAGAEKIFDDYMKKIGITPMRAVDPRKESYIANPLITGRDAFKLHSTHGLSFSTIKRLAREKYFVLDEDTFKKELEESSIEHVSRSAISAGRFKSGLADHSEQVTKLHTATHLLLAALRKVLGEHVFQKGSNITAERLRLDFSHPQRMTAEQIKKVEEVINEQINKDLPITCCEISLDEAKKMGAMGIFESKYGDKVKVYTVGDSEKPFSCEICAGPHIKKTGEMGRFRILKEEASSAGVRRIKAVVE
jgi:alanyl-tRNA synthetase